MDLLRAGFDFFYDLIKPVVFKLTEHDPLKAHEFFASFCQVLYKTNWDQILLDNLSNYQSSIELSNAAGFNENAQFPPRVLHSLGFDRVVVGTITYEPWEGNPRPTVGRFSSESLVNWKGFRGDGAEVIAERIFQYDNLHVPLTINFMSTPQKEGDEQLRDLEKTILLLRDLPCVDRFELNFSCPNTLSKSGQMDVRQEHLIKLDDLLKVAEKNIYSFQNLFLKVSPDNTNEEKDFITSIIKNRNVIGLVTTNTTTYHHPYYIPQSPQINGQKVGGASGNAVYNFSMLTQEYYQQQKLKLGLNWEIIACGGINSVERAEERINLGATGLQIYTPLVFSGPKLIRKLRWL